MELMYKIMMALVASLLVGCASDGGSTRVGQHGTDSTLSENAIEGLYLFKVETNMNTINVTGRDSIKVKI